MAMVLAVVLLIGAAVAAYFAWTLQVQQSPITVAVKDDEDGADTPADRPKETEDAATFDVVFARRAIEPGTAITAEELVVHELPVQPPQIYEHPDALVGKRVWRTIAEGEMIRPGHLREGSDLAATLLPAERAVAVDVDAVIGAGGLLAPGDRVDVLLYLKEAGRGGSSSAQVVLEDIRLLSFAERVQPPPDRAADAESERTEFRSETAVLAVPRADITRLMLASNAGKLRLALHSAASPARIIKKDFAVTDRLVTDTPPAELTGKPADLVQLDALLPEPPAPPEPPPQAKEPEPEPITIQIHRGASAETVELPQAK